MSTVKEFTPYLTDSGERAACVCGECGTPLAEENTTVETDLTLVEYETDGTRRVLYGLALLVVPTVLLSMLFPRLLTQITSVVSDKPLYIKNGLITGLAFVGLAMLGTVRFRTDGFQLLTTQRHERRVCSDCADGANLQSLVQKGTMLVGLAVAAYGLYLCVTGLFFVHLRWVGFGTAVYILRDEIAAFVSTLLA